jgi:uncharacterized protein
MITLFFAFVSTFFVGVSLGLLGGGGSILMLPIFHYLLQLPITQATGLSLLVVGSTAWFGAINYWRRGWIDLRVGLLFGIPSLVMAFAMRRHTVSSIPLSFEVFSIPLQKEQVILIVFAVILGIVSVKMLRSQTEPLQSHSESHKNHSREDSSLPTNVGLAAQTRKWFGQIRTLLSGMAVGFLTAFVGAGGGFLIVPTLTDLLKVPHRVALGTSLFVIGLNSTFGVAGDLVSGQMGVQELTLAAPYVTVSVVGMWLGSSLSQKINPERLRFLFGLLVLGIALFVLLKEFLLK